MTQPAAPRKYPLHCDRCVPLGPYTYQDIWYDLALHKDYSATARPSSLDYVMGNVRGSSAMAIKLIRLDASVEVHPVLRVALNRAHIKGLLPTNIEMFWKDE